MKRKVFTMGIVVMVPLIVVSIIISMMFAKSETVFDDFVVHEKQLGTLFEMYEKDNESMTDAELTAWEKEVDLVSSKAAQAFIEASKDAEHHDTLSLPGKYRRFLKAQSMFLSEPEYTGIAAKKLSEISSDEFDAWIAARDAAWNDHQRKWLRALGEDTEEEIEAWIASSNEDRKNDPQKQERREKMRQSLLLKESLARDRTVREREAAAYKLKRERDKAWLAAEGERLANGSFDISDTERVESQPPAAPEENRETSDNMRQSDADHILPSQPMSSADVPMQPKSRDTFNPDAVSDRLTQDLSRWEDDLVALYPELFRLKDAADQHVFEQSLPPDARRHFQQRKQRMQHEYVTRLNAFISDTPTEQREHTLRIVRKTLEKRWNSDFAESVLEQLDFSDN